MAAATGERKTGRMVSPHDQHRGYPMAAAVKIWKGTLVMVDAGFAKPGAVSTTAIAAGRAKETVDNSTGAAGDKTVIVEEGVFKWDALGADPPVAADRGKDVFISTDQEVSKTNGGSTKSRAGALYQVDSDGVWVQTGLGL